MSAPAKQDPAVLATDRLLDSLGSSSPFVDSTDWASHLLAALRMEAVARPMPERVTA